MEITQRKVTTTRLREGSRVRACSNLANSMAVSACSGQSLSIKGILKALPRTIPFPLASCSTTFWPLSISLSYFRR